MSKRDPLDQLAAFRVHADDEVRARDMEAIRTELRRTPPAQTVGRRRWTVAVVMAMILAGPAAAVASGDALPGDLLYPIKRVVEPIVQLFDRDVVVERRVEEVAGLVDRDSEEEVILERIDIARDALAESDAPLLEEELDRIVDRWVTDRSTGTPAVTDRPPATTAPRRDAPTGDGRDDPAPVDVPGSTTTTDRPATSEPPPSDRTTTTTAPRDTDDRPPSDDRQQDTP